MSNTKESITDKINRMALDHRQGMLQKIEELLLEKLEDEIDDIQESIRENETYYVVFSIKDLNIALNDEYIINERLLDDIHEGILPDGFTYNDDELAIVYNFDI